MKRLIWYESEKWVDAMRSGSHVHRDTITSYPFPMEEVLFRLLSRAKIGVACGSLSGLRILWEKYREEFPNFTVEPDELIREGWITCFCNRWDIVGFIRETAPEAADEKIREILAFLRWLQAERRAENCGVYLEDWTAALEELRKTYPNLPALDWFVEKHIAAEDRRHFAAPSYAPYHAYLHSALLRLWYYGGMDHEQWVELVSQLHLSAQFLDLMPHQARNEAVVIIAQRAIAGDVPTIDAENQRLLRHNMLESGKYGTNQRKTLREEDPVSNLLYLERWDWDSVSRLYERYCFLCFEIMAAAEYIHDIPEPYFSDVLDRLAALHERGMLFHPGVISPGACVRLLEFEQTQFLALHTLLLSYRYQSLSGNAPEGRCIDAWLRFALRQHGFENADGMCKLLAYLSEYAYRPGLRSQWERGLLEETLRELRRMAVNRMDFMSSLTNQLEEALDVSSSVTWGRRFQLLCSWTQALTDAGHGIFKNELKALYENILTRLEGLFDRHYNEEATFVSPEIFCLSFWPQLYQLADMRRRHRLLDPVRRWLVDSTPDAQEQFRAGQQMYLGLAWLTALAEAFQADNEVQSALESFLTYLLSEDAPTVYLVLRENDATADTIERAVHTLKAREGYESPIFQLELSGLLTVARYTNDKSLQEKLLSLAETAGGIQDDFGWDQVVRDVLDQKIEPLYGYCEDKLEEHIRACEERGWANSPACQASRSQLNRLWYLQGRYDKLFPDGDPWWKAVAYLTDGNAHDPRLAAREWKQLAEKTRAPAAYLNWMVSYIQLLEDASVQDDERRSVYWELDALRIKIEGPLFQQWPNDIRIDYAFDLTYIKTLNGMGENAALEQTIHELELTTGDAGRLREKWREEHPVSEPFTQDPTVTEDADALIMSALRRFRDAHLKRKAAYYLGSMDVALSGREDIALVFLEVLRTMYHLSAYGDKLLAEGELDEDHCTQLFREMFNHGASEWWKMLACDQQQAGSTGTVHRGQNKSAENDLVIKAGGYEQMVLEALVLKYCDTKSITKHLEKLIGDGRNRPMTLLIYGNSKNPVGLWKRIEHFLNGEFRTCAKSAQIQVKPFIPLRKQEGFYHPDLYDEGMSRLIDHTLVSLVSHRGGEQLPVFVLYSDVGMAANTEISKTARSG